MSGVCKRAAKSGAAVYAVCGCALQSDADPAELGIKKLFVSSDGTRTMDELLTMPQMSFMPQRALAQELLKCD